MFGPGRLSSMLMVACSRAWLRRTALTTRFSIYASVSEYLTSLLNSGAASLRRQPAAGPGGSPPPVGWPEGAARAARGAAGRRLPPRDALALDVRDVGTRDEPPLD